MSSSRPVTKALIVGLGSIGVRHARIIHELYPDIDVIALRHRGGTSDDKLPGVSEHVTSLKQALDFRPDIAIIANPAPFHLDVALPLAEAGIHLLIEKPLSSTTDSVEKLLRVADENSCKLMTAYNLRFLSSLRRFRDLLKEGVIGKYLSVRAEVGQYLPHWRPGVDYRKTVSANKDLGGGVLLELSHEIDMLLWLFGPINWVYAGLFKLSNLEINVEDSAYLLLGFDEKVIGYNLTASLNMDFIRHDTTRRCIVIGEYGTLKWDAVEGSVELFHANKGEWETLYLDKPERDFTYRHELSYFIDCIENGKEPFIDGRSGLAVLEVVDAARRSFVKGSKEYLARGVSM